MLLVFFLQSVIKSWDMVLHNWFAFLNVPSTANPTPNNSTNLIGQEFRHNSFQMSTESAGTIQLSQFNFLSTGKTSFEMKVKLLKDKKALISTEINFFSQSLK